MATRVKVGALVPLKGNDEEDSSSPTLPVFQGSNMVGRSNLSIPDKQVSRKHIILNGFSDGSAEITLEGQNPISLRSGTSRKRLSPHKCAVLKDGDIIELIPGKYPFKYKKTSEATLEEPASISPRGANEFSNPSLDGMESTEVEKFFLKGKRQVLNDEVFPKRRRQLLEDEEFARTLQAIEYEQACAVSRDNYSSMNTTNSGHHQGLRDMDDLMKNDQSEPIRQFNVPQQFLSSTFRLMHVQGLPTWANTGSVTIGDVIKGDVLVAILSNYMVDMDWLLSVCPILRTIPHVLLIHGESGGTLEYLKKKKPSNWLLYKPPLRLSYGTHHSKAMLLVYSTGVRVVVHTANLIYVDWNNKTQGLWMQDFPLKEKKDLRTTSPFENDLVEYLEALEWAGFSAQLPQTGDVMINAAYFRRFDYSAAAVRLVASVPGYHQGPKMKKWGHMKIRTILQEQFFEKEFQGSPLVYQFSSLGSLDEKWMAEFNSSMFSGYTFDKQPLGSGSIQIIWPSVEDVCCSLEGYAAGNAIPSPHKNVEKEFLKRYWARWQANHIGRCRAMPHIKTYSRYNGQSLAWFLLTSSNLSKAAWGVLQKNSSQLMIRSYELGVIFLPSLVLNSAVKFSCTDDYGHQQVKCSLSANQDVNASYPAKLVTLCWQGRKSELSPLHIVTLPVPYKLPAKPYTSEDVPWSWDREYGKPDVYGEVWPRSVKLYTNQ
ncbi:tyrosyl-DNA phosphodiesterase 1 isoform X1 [Cryptomeria japonica]|uniref:tyrosyl-DNA phosphodiesterase 1 isoform X1 n=1 Tax=Cryptomeria japonica TaxID=3369 RepID=UPI0027DA4892|nr:tyrosyl-DNA phosphodiesterase 1 isoform X1 [Cryptomeria japonica]